VALAREHDLLRPPASQRDVFETTSGVDHVLETGRRAYVQIEERAVNAKDI
jgi:hypothetical protein